MIRSQLNRLGVYKVEEDDKVPFLVYLTTPFQLNWLRSIQVCTCLVDYLLIILNTTVYTATNVTTIGNEVLVACSNVMVRSLRRN